MRKIVIILLHLVLFAMLVMLLKHRTTEVVEVEVITRDTITIVDTLIITKPIPVYIHTIDTMYIHTTDTSNNEVVVALPREEKVYEDSTYRAVISGYMPTLDAMEVYARNNIVKIKEQMPSPRWSWSIQGGVGITPKGLQPYIGFGASYRLNK